MKLFIVTMLAIAGFAVFAESQDRLNAMPEEDMTLASIGLSDEQIYCLAQNIYFEAGNQSLEAWPQLQMLL